MFSKGSNRNRIKDAYAIMTRAAIVLALAVGATFGAVTAARNRSDITFAELFALSCIIGVACLTPFVAVGGAVGLSVAVSGGLFVVCSALLAMLLRSKPRTSAPTGTIARSPAQQLLFWTAIGLVLAKVLHFPLWSWDYYAIWGVKARRLVTAGGIDYSFLPTPLFNMSNPQYPIGLPLAAQLIFLGEDVGASTWKALHIAVVVALLLIVRATVRVAGGREAGENGWAAYAAIMPLFWDTESVGLADAPLALVAAAAVFFIVRDSSQARMLDSVPLGICVGFLPWIKDEGLTLTCYLVLVALVVFPPGRRRWRPWIVFCGVVGAFVGASLCVRLCCLGSGASFLVGDWLGRVANRAHHPMEVLVPLMRDLVGWQWWGCWLAFLMGVVIAAKRRSVVALAISAVVMCQLITYAAVYFASYITPTDHIASSFHRIAAALSPIAIVSVAVAVVGGATRRDNDRHDVPEPVDGVACDR